MTIHVDIDELLALSRQLATLADAFGEVSVDPAGLQGVAGATGVDHAYAEYAHTWRSALVAAHDEVAGLAGAVDRARETYAAAEQAVGGSATPAPASRVVGA